MERPVLGKSGSIFIFVLVMLILPGQAFAQKQKDTSIPFYLDYRFCGLGSNWGKFFPVFEIIGNRFLFSEQQNTWWQGLRDARVDTITYGTLRQSSIDSILAIVAPLKDSTITGTTLIMSGGVHYLTIASGGDTTRVEMHNTFDRTGLKVTDILNTYATVKKKIWVNEAYIKQAEDLWKEFEENYRQDSLLRERK